MPAEISAAGVAGPSRDMNQLPAANTTRNVRRRSARVAGKLFVFGRINRSPFKTIGISLSAGIIGAALTLGTVSQSDNLEAESIETASSVEDTSNANVEQISSDSELSTTLYQSMINEEYSVWLHEKMEEYDIKNSLEQS